jgi:hypothetical protein
LDDLTQTAVTCHRRYDDDKRDLITSTAFRLEEHLGSIARIQYIRRISEMMLFTLRKKTKGFITDSYMNKYLQEKYRVPPAPRIVKPQMQNILPVMQVKPKTVEELLVHLENAYRIVTSIINQINITGREEGLTSKEIIQKINERIKTD